MNKKISVIIPAYNEEACIQELESRLIAVVKIENKYDWEIIVIENGSTDSTWEKLKVISQNNKIFKVVKLSRNFRMDGGLTAGLEYVTGDACVLMTADLQDPPEIIPIFFNWVLVSYCPILTLPPEHWVTLMMYKPLSIAFFSTAINQSSEGAFPDP